MTQDLILLEWSNNCNLKNTIYEAGMIYQLILEACYDFPQITRTERLSENTAGRVKMKSSIQKQWCVFEVCDIPESMLATYHCIRDNSNVFITDLKTGQRSRVLEYQFTFENQDDCFLKGRFQLHLDSKVKTSCCRTGQVQIL